MTNIQTLVRRTPASIWVVVLVASCMALFGPSRALSQVAIAEPWVVPDRASHRVNPVVPDEASVKNGRQIFEAGCQKCHGKAGRGDGPQAQFLDTPPADLTSQAVRDESDGALFWKMSEGRGLMPKVTAPERNRWLLVTYIRSLQKKY